jgi:1-acyl-sn-glycerol-3-phosphate acyltransferase
MSSEKKRDEMTNVEAIGEETTQDQEKGPALEEGTQDELAGTRATDGQARQDRDLDAASEGEMREELASELDGLIQRLRALDPEYEPPRFTRQGFVSLIEESLKRCPKDLQLDVLERLRTAVNEQWFDPETWKGIWYMVNYTVKYNADLVQRRYTGEYDTDEWGVDWEFLDVVRPFFTFLYRVYWRVNVTGIEQIPVQGRTLLVANHSGQLPWDGMMIATAVMNEHAAQRLVRTLYSDWVPSVPFFSAWLVRMGQTLATEDNGIRLLEQDELVAIFPEGHKGIGKVYRDRYRLARFDQGSFVQMALETQAPIVPVSVVGAEETYISVVKSATAARLTGLPYFPISPTFPWLGLLGLVPLPTRWHIDFGEPITLDGYGPDAAQNLVLVSQLSDQVRNTVQEMIHGRLAQRKSVFF